MKNKEFVHLHCHDEYSLLDGVGSPDKWCSRAKELGFEYLAIVNHGNIDNMIKFQQAADKHGIKPIFGSECYIVPDRKVKKPKEKRGHITLLVKNETGFNNLCLMINNANVDGFYYRPRIDYQDLLDHCEGLVVMTACISTFLHLEGGVDLFWDLDDKIRGDLYMEVMPHLHEKQYSTNEVVLNIYDKYPDIPLIATNDCHYINKSDAKSQDVLLAVNSKSTWNDPNRWSFDIRDMHLKTADEMIKQFKEQDQLSDEEITAAMETSISIAEKCCDFRIEQRKITLPIVREDGADFLDKTCYSALTEMFGSEENIPDEYLQRFDFEFDLLKKKDFIHYFLIVHELVDWCFDNDIMVGPGRGSVGGSLIAYLLGITMVDPLEFDLLFERFIAEDRNDYPDIDLDFEDIRRPEIKLHLMDLYGENNIAGVSTFIKMKGKYCVRDVSRVFEVPLKEVNEFCETIEDTVAEAIAADRTFQKNNPEVAELILKLEGNIRGSGKHAAALIISPNDLTKGQYSTLAMRKGDIVINWDKDDAEYMGLMKLDVLGLNTLTVLNEAKRLIKQNHDWDVYFSEIPLDDADVLATMDGKNTAGLFQLSGYMARHVTSDLGVDSFDDIVAIMALGRPGPFKSGMTDEYIRRKKGKQWKRMNDAYEDVLKKTHGIVVYQEDVMFIINKVAGMGFSAADKIRKIIGKKRDVKEFAPYEKKFVEGCLKQETLTEREAHKVWDGFLEWAEYGFNKAHSVEYAMIAYWCAYLKHYYPNEFFCANLTYGKEDKKKDIITEAKAMDLEVSLPKINISDPFKWVTKDNKLYVPFIEIKGVGDKMAPKLATLKRAMPKLNDKFFTRKITTALVDKKNKKSKLEQIADDIGAWGNLCPITAKTQEYFSFQISDRIDVLYPNLCTVIDDMFPCDVEDVLSGKVGYPHLIHDSTFGHSEVQQCKFCSLRGRCKAPIRPSIGLSNVAIIDGVPSKEDDKKGIALTGEPGDVLWEKLKKEGYGRNRFHVSNIIKCFPGPEKPSSTQIKKCSENWLLKEVDEIDCRIILALGALPVKVFGDDSEGIQKLNATTTWNDQYQSWICWCVHPKSTFMEDSNKRRFNYGIKNFVKTLQRFGLKK